MSDNSDKAAWQVTTDREQIREWAEEYETVPILDGGSGGTELRLLANPVGDRGEQVSWDRFFERFEDGSLALRYRETAAGEGQPAYELVSRDEISDAGSARDTHDREAETSADSSGAGVTQVDSGTADRSDATPETNQTSTADGTDDTNRNTSASSRDAATGSLGVDEIHGDHGFGDGVEEEYVTFQNTGEEALNVSGWVVENEDGQQFAFPEGLTLDAGQRVTVHSGSGSDTGTDVYWGATGGVWDDDGDTITAKTADGREVLREPYVK